MGAEFKEIPAVFDCQEFHELCMDYRGASVGLAQHAYEQLQAYCALCISETTYRWIPVSERLPRVGGMRNDGPREYVLAVDAKGRMSVGYIPYRYSQTNDPCWTFAKPISEPTHWMPLPEAPKC